MGAVLGFAAAPEAKLPLVFIPNAGQADSQILYLVQTPALHAGFTANSMFFQADGAQLQVRFAGANPGATMEGAAPLAGHANFLNGSDPEQWRTDLPTYGKVVYRDLYPGIDATYAGANRHIKSEFLVSPGADPHRIQMDYGNARHVRIDADGSLVVTFPGGEMREDPPEVYQITPEGGRIRVPSTFRLLTKTLVGFDVTAYDRSLPLVIDPVITYSTYLGGSGMGAVTGVAVDATGNLYVTGWTEAVNFPIGGAYQAGNKGSVDAFVVKLNADGSGIYYATYLGGAGDDRGAGIAVDSTGQAHVVGSTSSSDFPLAISERAMMMGGKEGFVLKLTQNGSGVVFSTFVGGAG